ncbi:MAG: amino acid ABC transporter ATP-binding protein [Clostridia bacterium]|nr:amino acid ABC transporter ATP-binding protein [Clostridia bacterium]MDY2929477.1 amino acid ABC transporter ATP-binding protein [Clostridiaceae bacterium]
MELLTIKNLQKTYDGKLEVLRNIDLTVEEGETVAIIGPSGSGKSTLLRCATLLTEMTGGSLSYLGEAVVTPGENGKAVYAGKNELRRARSYFGLVFQNFNLFPNRTVLQNLTDAQIRVLKRNKDQAVEKARALLDKMGLSDKESAYPCQLSGGQQQRVAIARALAMDPRILFFDEPTSALDPELTGEVLKIIRELAQEKMTMVVVTHEMAFARDVAQRVVFMDGGVIVEEGPPEQVFGAPQQERTRKFLQRYSQG